MGTYKAEIELINSFSKDFTQHIPEQRKKVDELMNAGLIVSYALAIDRTKIWVVFEAKKFRAGLRYIEKFPSLRFYEARCF